MTTNDLPTQPEAEPRHKFQPYKRTMYCGAPLDIYARCCRLEDHPVHTEPSKQEPRRDDDDDGITKTRWWAWLGAILLAGDVALGIYFLLSHDLFTSVVVFGAAAYITKPVWENRGRLL